MPARKIKKLIAQKKALLKGWRTGLCNEEHLKKINCEFTKKRKLTNKNVGFLFYSISVGYFCVEPGVADDRSGTIKFLIFLAGWPFSSTLTRTV